MSEPMRTKDGRLIGCSPDSFHGLSDAERKEAIGILMGLGNYAWPDGRVIYTGTVMIDVDWIAFALRTARGTPRPSSATEEKP